MMCSFSTDNQRRPFLLWKDTYFSISLRMLKNNLNMNQLITIGACILTICSKKSQSNASSMLGSQEEILITTSGGGKKKEKLSWHLNVKQLAKFTKSSSGTKDKTIGFLPFRWQQSKRRPIYQAFLNRKRQAPLARPAHRAAEAYRFVWVRDDRETSELNNTASCGEMA